MNANRIDLKNFITASDMDFSPPFIPIIDGNTHAAAMTRANIFACMLYPSAIDQTKRRKLYITSYLWFLSESKEDTVILDRHMICDIINTPHIDIESLIKISNTNGQEGHIAGIILFFIHELHKASEQHLISEVPSLSKASFFAREGIREEKKYKNKHNKKLPESRDQLERYWYAYKPAAHLWLAAWLIQVQLRESGNTAFAGNAPLLILQDATLFRKFFKIAEYYRNFGETFNFKNTGARPCNSLLGPNEAWRPTPNLALDGITLTIEKNVYPGLQDLLSCWKKRKKW
ncbi:hypothetical protein [Solidesulfovibrio sp.]